MKTSSSTIRPFAKQTLVKGRAAQLECLDIAGQVFSVSRGLITSVTLEDEWYGEVNDAPHVIELLGQNRELRVDMFSFCQRLPNVEPRLPYYHELESVAAIPIDSYEYWWSKQIEGATRNQIRKSRKAGVEVRLSPYDDDFVRGITAIFNETLIRQGRRFWHYGKDFETVKEQFSRNLFREELIGAYYQNEMIGFAMLGAVASFADLGQVIAKIAHRDKSVTTALVDRAVARCAERHIPYLVYGLWGADSLSQFKRRHGFREYQLPRYFIPLTHRGRLALKAGVHRGLTTMLPISIKAPLKRLRTAWYLYHERNSAISAR